MYFNYSNEYGFRILDQVQNALDKGVLFDKKGNPNVRFASKNDVMRSPTYEMVLSMVLGKL